MGAVSFNRPMATARDTVRTKIAVDPGRRRCPRRFGGTNAHGHTGTTDGDSGSPNWLGPARHSAAAPRRQTGRLRPRHAGAPGTHGGNSTAGCSSPLTQGSVFAHGTGPDADSHKKRTGSDAAKGGRPKAASSSGACPIRNVPQDPGRRRCSSWAPKP